MLFLKIAVCSLFGMLLQCSHNTLILGGVKNQNGSFAGCLFPLQAMLSEILYKNSIRVETPAYVSIIDMSLLNVA